jgi:hypothetical protein
MAMVFVFLFRPASTHIIFKLTCTCTVILNYSTSRCTLPMIARHNMALFALRIALHSVTCITAETGLHDSCGFL